jgi:hypothetical protein
VKKRAKETKGGVEGMEFELVCSGCIENQQVSKIVSATMKNIQGKLQNRVKTRVKEKSNSLKFPNCKKAFNVILLLRSKMHRINRIIY